MLLSTNKYVCEEEIQEDKDIKEIYRCPVIILIVEQFFGLKSEAMGKNRNLNSNFCWIHK